MSDISILKKMIKDTALIILENRYNKKIVELKEPPPADYAITIHGMPDDDNVVVIKTDTFSSPNSIFKGDCGECKRADFVIIANYENKRVIICIEMKAGKGEKEKEIIQQLKGTECFVAYCGEIGRLFWNEQHFLKDYTFRFISIRDIKIPKKPSRVANSGILHDRPERMLKISSPAYLQLKRLIEGN